MRRAHVAFLACPDCSGDLEASGTDERIESGSLGCTRCRREYPIEDGVPRLLLDDGARTGAGPGPASDARSRASFGYEWLRYPVTSAAEDLVTLVGLTGVEPRFYEQVRFRNLFSLEPDAAMVGHASTTYFAGKRVLEAGCGMGKYVAVVARAGATLAVGLDASASVGRAAALVRELPNALIVQGDIFRPPLRPGFDFAYSVGVLHHTALPRLAFLRTAALVRDQGEMAVWLYPHAGRPLALLHEWLHERLLRPLTSRLPLPLLERLCSGLGRLTALKTRLKERGGGPRRAAAALLNVVAVGEHRDPEIAAFLNFDWYSPRFRFRHTEAELGEWYRTAGFEPPAFLPVAVSARGRKKAVA